jgi:hypothetical protein
VVTGYPARDVALAAGTLCPYDSQNTVIVRELMPANMLWSFSPREPATRGWARFDDILAGYAGQVVAWRHGWQVRFGRPFVHQERNPHDLLDDLLLEVDGMRAQRAVLDALRAAPLAGRSPAEDLGIAVDAVLAAVPAVPRVIGTYVRTWLADLARLGVA